jgi:hypothetical protein
MEWPVIISLVLFVAALAYSGWDASRDSKIKNTKKL